MSYKTIDIDRQELVDATVEARRKGVGYKLGAKAQDINSIPGPGKSIDCSGWMRILLRRAANTIIPDGSWLQREWCERQGFKRSTYDQNGAGLKDGRVRIAFIRPKGERAGHVWALWMGKTFESYYRNGPGNRAWDTKTLKSRATDCYVLDMREIEEL